MYQQFRDSTVVVQVTVNHLVVGSIPTLGANTRNGGREAQCKGLQILQAAGSNPARCSKVDLKRS